MTDATLLIAGRRYGLLKAAERLGQPVILLDPSSTTPGSVKTHLRVHFSEAAGYWTDLAQRLARAGPLAGVVAATEKAVLPAARLRQALELPGVGPEVALRCRDKALMKRRIQEVGLACADFRTAEDQPDRLTLLAELGLPLVLKPRDLSGGRGRKIIQKEAEIPESLEPGWMAESFVSGVEMSVETFSLEGRVLFTNLTEYFVPGWANIVPAELDPGVADRILRFNRQVLETLGITRGMTHLEIFLNGDRIVFGEIALRPPGGHLMELLEAAYGLDPWQLLIEVETGAGSKADSRSRCFAGMAIFHPGAGRIESIEGVDEIRTLPGVRLKLRAQPGQRLVERLGSGQEAGHLLATGASREEVASKLRTAMSAIRFRMEPNPSGLAQE